MLHVSRIPQDLSWSGRRTARSWTAPSRKWLREWLATYIPHPL